MCVNTWGGFEVIQGRQGPFLRDVCRTHKSDPALFSPWDNLDRVQNHGEGTVAFFSTAFRELSYILSPDERWRTTSHQMILEVKYHAEDRSFWRSCPYRPTLTFLEVFSWNVTFVGNPGIFGFLFGIAGMEGESGHNFTHRVTQVLHPLLLGTPTVDRMVKRSSSFQFYLPSHF